MVNQKKWGHSSFSFTKHENGRLEHSDTYRVVAGVDEIPDTQDTATYQEEEVYTPGTWIVGVEEVADTRAD